MKKIIEILNIDSMDQSNKDLFDVNNMRVNKTVLRVLKVIVHLMILLMARVHIKIKQVKHNLEQLNVIKKRIRKK